MKLLTVSLLLVLSTLLLFSATPRCTDFILLGFSGKGVIVPARMCAVPIRGVYVEPMVTGTKLAESLYVAYTAFERKHGPLGFGVVLDVRGPVTYVDGRSADLALYSALYSLAFGVKPLPATGRIAEDLYTVDGVAYVREKLSVLTMPAIIPYANRYDAPRDIPFIPVRNLDEVDSALAGSYHS